MGRRTAGPLTLPPGGLDRLRRLADESAPKEACGLLLGRRRKITEIVPVPNVAEGTDCFVMDPGALFAVLYERDDVVGSWHSHPTATAGLSDADRAGSPNDWYQVVVGPTESPATPPVTMPSLTWERRREDHGPRRSRVSSDG